MMLIKLYVVSIIKTGIKVKIRVGEIEWIIKWWSYTGFGLGTHQAVDSGFKVFEKVWW